MHHQHELAVLGREQEPLGAPFDACEALPDERGERRIERLQRGDMGRAGLLNGASLDVLVELAAPGLDLGQLGHLRSCGWTRSG